MLRIARDRKNVDKKVGINVYEQATVLKYKNKKIWIKKVAEYIYLANGCLLGFSKKWNIDRVENIVRLLDEYYTPFTKEDIEYYGDYCLLIDSGRTISPIHCCSICKANRERVMTESDVDAVRKEYIAWSDTVDKKDLYLNDRRFFSPKEWFDYCSENEVSE